MSKSNGNKRIIILEGIPTSGKTSIINQLKRDLINDEITDFDIIFEDKTLMEILSNEDPLKAKKHLQFVFDNYINNSKKRILIVDRFHYTHTFRSHTTIDYFKDFEDWFCQNKTNIVLLKISSAKIMERINYSISHRGQSWRDYVSKRGGVDEVFKYYYTQQEELFKIAGHSKINNICINTDQMEWQVYSKHIKKLI